MSTKLSITYAIYDNIINFHQIHPNTLTNVIDVFCSTMSSLEELFMSRFCFSLEHGLILLNMFNNRDDNNNDMDVDTFDSNNFVDTCGVNDDITIPEHCVFGLNFVNYKHPSNLNIKSTLQQYSLNNYYTKYCQYLNKLVVNIISYHYMLPNITRYLKKLPSKFRIQISNMKQASVVSNINILDYLRCSPFNSKYPTEHLIEILKIAAFEFKTRVTFGHFKYLIDKIKTKQHNKNFDKKDIEDFEHLTMHATTLYNRFQQYRTPIMYAAHVGVVECITILIKYQTNINYVNHHGMNALMIAAQNGHVDCFLKLLENTNVDLNSQTFNINNNENILIFVSRIGNVNCLTKLIEHGAILTTQDINGRTALMYAAEFGSLECLLELIENGANLDVQDKYGKTALMYAARHGRSKCLLKLIENNANIDIKDVSRKSALMYAFSYEHTHCIKILIINKANVDFLYTIGYTPLMLAILSYNSETLKLIKNNKDKLHLKTKYGITALILAAACGYTKYINKLLAYNVDIDTQDIYGNTALMYAARKKHYNSLLELIKGGANIDNINCDGTTALMVAAKYGHLDCLDILIKNGANVNIRGKNGMTALMFATQEGHVKCLFKLIENNANLNIQDDSGKTAVIIAALKDNCKCLLILVKRGASLKICDFNGASAFEIARDYGNFRCMKLLEAH